jgi:hypothetical protein
LKTPRLPAADGVFSTALFAVTNLPVSQSLSWLIVSSYFFSFATASNDVFHFSKTSTTPDRLTRSPLLAQCFTLRGNFFGEIPGMPETNRN